MALVLSVDVMNIYKSNDEAERKINFNLRLAQYITSQEQKPVTK
jgi:hypothetical protein